MILMLGSVLMSSSVAEPQQLNLMPMPASVQIKAGQLAIDSSFSVGISGHSDAQLQRSSVNAFWMTFDDRLACLRWT